MKETEDEKIRIAVQNSSIEELKRQEKDKGFIEKPLKAERFFREGKINYFNESASLYTSLIKEIDKDLLEKLNYDYGKKENQH